MKNRNSTPEAVCQKCGNTGQADSGGVQSWGEPISIPCDCLVEQEEFLAWASEEYEVEEGYELNESNPAVMENKKGWMARAALPKRSKFRQHLDECADEVDTWPSYKREALKNPCTTKVEQAGDERAAQWHECTCPKIGEKWNPEKHGKDCPVHQARAALAQPSPASDLDPLNLAPHAEAFNEAPAEALKPGQAEAERPEVVDFNPYRYHAEKIRQRADGAASAYEAGRSALGYMEDIAESALIVRNGLDELSAQHERIVEALRFERQQMDRAFTACINERDAALAKCAELETALTPFAAVADAYDDSEDDDHEPYTDMGCDDRLRLTLSQHRAARTALSGVPAQAQHSVPEEFSFEYRHPNGECHTITVSREQVINEMPDFLFEALCSKFCNCEPVGETNVVECCCDEYAEEFKLIDAAPGKEVV
ncbi:hypothetical protein LSL4_gp153 [Pseudomonas phage LSL4]|nr:hypothetical protein LSL4_gp153 [Pseudomonas phage LSL4]